MAVTYRCTAAIELDGDVRATAEKIGSPRPDIEWATVDLYQCKVEDVPHDFHAAFLRTGARTDPDSDVFLCWRDGPSVQWLEDIEVCLKAPAPLGSVCTIFRGHPGQCDWAYVDPPQVAAQAMADQLIQEWGLSHMFRSHD
ncbi:hypothetical protein ACWCV9_28505 [Streptomyces sp. NPDC001606]